MTSEALAYKATHSPELKLEGFEEFVGVGVVPVRPRSRDMVVAVYVSIPSGHLSQAFRSKVPKSIKVLDHDKAVDVLTKIVNIGQLTPG